MAIIPKDEFPAQIDVTDPVGYPHGKAQDVVSQGDGIGTPWLQPVANDIFGFQQSLLAEAGITPSGVADKVGASDYLDALHAIFLIRAWRLDYAQHAGDSLDFSAQVTDVESIAWGDHGRKLYVLDSSGTGLIQSYNLSDPYSPRSAVPGTSFALGWGANEAWDLFVHPDGTSITVVRNSPASVYEFALSTKWDVATASQTASLDVSTQNSAPQVHTWNAAGSKLYVLGDATDANAIKEYTAVTPWAVTGAFYNGLEQVFATGSEIVSMVLGDSDRKIFVAPRQSGADVVEQYDLSTPGLITSAQGAAAGTPAESVDLTAQAPQLKCIAISPRGGIMIAADRSLGTMFDYTISRLIAP